MNRLLICTLAALALSTADLAAVNPSDSVTIVSAINASGSIVVSQPAEVNALLIKVPGADDLSEESHKSNVSKVGYRVQVFDDNNPRTARRNAEAYHAQMQKQFPEFRSYLSFNSPYWRVRVGDFHNRAEAEAVMAEIRRAVPALSAYLRIIRDKINFTE